MTTESGEKPDEREQRPQPQERGGSAVDDMSKSLGTDEPDSPFGGSREETGAGKDKQDE
ncbi:MAG: hypothetical protein ACJ754_03890 [Pyrinomonadaceae bacterium]